MLHRTLARMTAAARALIGSGWPALRATGARVYRENEVTWSPMGWIVAGWSWPRLSSRRRWDKRNAETFVVHTLDGHDLGRPVGPFQFCEVQLATTPAGRPALLWLDYDDGHRCPHGPVTGYVRSAVYTEQGWGPVQTIATGVSPSRPRGPVIVRQPDEQAVATRTILIGSSRLDQISGVFLRLQCTDGGWRVVDQVDADAGLHLARVAAVWSTAEPTTSPPVVLGGVDPQHGRPVLHIIADKGTPPIQIDDVPAFVHALGVGQSSDGVRWIVAITLAGAVMTLVLWRERSPGEWRRMASWSPPDGFQIQEWQVLEVSATTVCLGLAIARVVPELFTTLMLTWTGTEWAERHLPNEGPAVALCHPRWLRGENGQWGLWRHRRTARTGLAAMPVVDV